MSDTYSYLGLQDASSATGEGNRLAFLIKRFLLGRVSTATVCRVVRAPYDAAGDDIAPGAAVPVGYVDVQPMVNQVDGYGNAMPHGTVHHVSYHRYAGGSGAFIADPAVGDIGKLVVADRDTSAVRATNAVSNPGSRRYFSKADGTYFGSTQGGAAPAQWCAFTATGFAVRDRNGNSITLSPSGITLADANGNVVQMASGGVTVTVTGGRTVTVTAGGSPDQVETTAGPSPVLRADG